MNAKLRSLSKVISGQSVSTRMHSYLWMYLYVIECGAEPCTETPPSPGCPLPVAQIPPSATHQDCVHCHGLLATTLADEAAAAKFMAACASRFPWSAHFGGAKRQAVDLVELTKSVKELKV